MNLLSTKTCGKCQTVGNLPFSFAPILVRRFIELTVTLLTGATMAQVAATDPAIAETVIGDNEEDESKVRGV